MWIKIKAWEGAIYPDPEGKPVDVKPGDVLDVPKDLGDVLIAKGIAGKTSAPKVEDSPAEPATSADAAEPAADPVT